MAGNKRLYQGAYNSDQDMTTTEDVPSDQDVDADTTTDQNLSPENSTWKKRYADLRTHSTSLTERVRTLELQLQAANKKDIKIPSTPQEMEQFARNYPDVARYISSIALTHLLTEKEHITQQTQVITEDLERLKRERGLQKIMQAHPDFEDVNMSEDFHVWARQQPQQIQDWLFEGNDPDLCIRGLDLFKAERKAKAKVTRPPRADVQIRPRGDTDIPTEMNGKRVWRASELAKMHPSQYEKFEADIDAARDEGRFVQDVA